MDTENQQQTVFTTGVFADDGDGFEKNPWADERLIPFYVAVASLFTLLVHGIWSSKLVQKLRGTNTRVGNRNPEVFASFFKASRLCGVLAVTCLTIYTAASHGGRNFVDIALVATLFYSSILAVLDTFASSTKFGITFSRHLTLVTFAMLAVYSYRDVWPLMTFTLQPQDSVEGNLLWAKLALFAFVSVVEPLFEPYPYIAYDPEKPMAAPSPEQTASLASFLTYTWMGPTIWQAYRAGHLTFEQLPSLCDYDEIRNLIKRSYPRMDPFSGARRGNLFWGLIKTFWSSILSLAVLLLVHALAKLAVPIGTNRLLDYLENQGEGAVVKPWVWIIWLGLGPFVATTVFQLYVFIAVAVLVRMEAIFVSLVFDHSLRIRMKAESEEKSDASTPQSKAVDSDSEHTDEDTEEATGSHSRSATNATGDSSTVAGSAADDDAEEPSQSAASQKPDTKDASTGNANLVGKINNLVTSDVENIKSGRDFLFLAISTPLVGALSMWFLYNILGWSAFVGLAVMVAGIPVPAWLSSLMNGAQKEKMKATDARVQSVTEIMSALRMVKMFGWESQVAQTVLGKRETELSWIWKRELIHVVTSCLNFLIPQLHMVATYGIYTVIMKKELTAAIVFSSLAAFDMLQNEVMTIVYLIPELITANVSLGRLADFLRNTELLDSFVKPSPDEIVVESSWTYASDIGFGKANFAWARNSGTPTRTKRMFRLRIEEEVKFKEGAFNLVVGPTGSGKTSVLMALLGEMHYIPLGYDSWVNLPKREGVAYAAQESWVQNETIKENILFGAPYDAERYNKVVYQCALIPDLNLFDARDETEVGEKGLTLSGGQKARLTLARAIYSSAKVLLLDDVLASLDVHTSRWIVDKCFKGDLVRGRTVILITHNIALVSPLADFVVSLRDGRIMSQGSFGDALSKDEELAEEYKHDEEAIELDKTEDAELSDGVDDVTAAVLPSKGKLVVAEEKEEGDVSWKTFMLYLNGLGGKWATVFWTQYVTQQSLEKLFVILEMWWLGFWAKQYATRDSNDVSVAYYLGMYGAIVGVFMVTFAYGQLLYTYASLRASRVIHAKLVHSLLGSTFRWLDVTPISRIITRCTQDIQAVDGPISAYMAWFVETSIDLVAKLAVVLLFTPPFLLPALAIGLVGGFLGKAYIKAQLSIKREMSTAKAPVLGIFNGAIVGLTSVRAYGAQEMFKTLLHKRIDHYIRVQRSFWNLNRWVSMRLDTLGQMFTASLAFYLVYGTANPSPSSIGFVLVMAVSFSSTILALTRVYSELEIRSNSLERIQQYIDIEHEPEPKDEGKPPAYWPSSGNLRVENLFARYSLDGPQVLQDINFQVKAGERVGVVGRTGSGKSTLTLAILRCIYTEGSVIFDGLPIHTINLDALRSNVTIIPQVPELLNGSLRHNLDVSGQYDDTTLNDALRAAGLFSVQHVSDENRITLDTEVTSGGKNFSLGQRQIIALARAIVRQSKLLILDEATSAIDYETDAVIQASLRTELKNDVTVITVAHRLQTIMDYDKIMVLDSGRLIEYDTPKALLAKDGSLLRALVDESLDKDKLYVMATTSRTMPP